MTKRDLPAAVIGARDSGLQAELPTLRALDLWVPGLQARAADAASDTGPFQIDVLEVIGEDPWTGGGFTAAKLGGLLRASRDRDVTININSPGGNVFEGLTIYNMLREHPQPVTVRILGLAASAASIIAMAGDTIQIAKAGFLMVHNVWGAIVGDRNDLAETIEYMTMVDEVMADLYAQRSGVEVPVVAAMMDRETYLSGKVAVDRGFADEFLPSDQVAVALSARAEPEPVRALRKIEVGLARSGLSRTQARALIRPLFSGRPSAADDGTPSAAAQAAFASLLAEVKSTTIA